MPDGRMIHDLQGYRLDRYIPWKCGACGRPVLVNDYGQSREHDGCDTTQAAPKFNPSAQKGMI